MAWNRLKIGKPHFEIACERPKRVTKSRWAVLFREEMRIPGRAVAAVPWVPAPAAESILLAGAVGHVITCLAQAWNTVVADGMRSRFGDHNGGSTDNFPKCHLST